MHHIQHFYLKQREHLNLQVSKNILVIENAFNEIHFHHCITHPPVRKHRHTISVLSWAPRIPSSASGYFFISLRSYLFYLVKGLLWPNTANIACIFCLCIW